MMCPVAPPRKPLGFLIGLSMLAIVLIAGCAKNSIQFQLTETKAFEETETIPVEVDNCTGYLPDIRAYSLPGGVGAANLTPNGGEPFRTIRQALAAKYGKSLRTIQLFTPIRTHRVFTIAVTLTLYEGDVTGAVIDANKIAPQQPVTYHYPLVTDASIESSEDVPCGSN
jgi:hypothetical protein